MNIPIEYNYYCDSDILSDLEKIKENLKNKTYNTIINEEYVTRRSKVVEYLKKLSESFELSEKTFAMALCYMDTLLVNNCRLKYDMTAIGCLLLSSNEII